MTVYEMGSAAYATNAAGAITSTLTTSAAVSAGAAGGFSGGFVGGMIGSDGDPEVGFEDGLFGAAMGAIGGIDINGGLGGAVERGALEGRVNGTLSAAAGGSFRSGFIGGMVGSVGFYEVGGIKTGTSDWAVAGKVAMLSTVSGTVSALSGGKPAHRWLRARSFACECLNLDELRRGTVCASGCAAASCKTKVLSNRCQ